MLGKIFPTLQVYNWGDTTPEGVWIHEVAKTDLWALQSVMRNLCTYGLYIAGMNEQGVLIGCVDSEREELLREVATDISNLGYKINNLEVDMKNVGVWIEDFKIKFENVKKEGAPKEITEEFYLFADLLPEKIRKEIKIYKL